MVACCLRPFRRKRCAAGVGACCGSTRQHWEALQSLVAALSAHPQEPQADWETGACREQDRVSMQQLIDGAHYGQPGDDWGLTGTPSRECLRQRAMDIGPLLMSPPRSPNPRWPFSASSFQCCMQRLAVAQLSCNGPQPHVTGA